MKKVLYGTSALLVAGIFASAAEAAAPLKLNVNGNLNAWVGYTDIDSEVFDGQYNKFDVATTGTIKFHAATKLDNGLSVGGVAEVNVGHKIGEDWLGDVYAYAESNFGKVIMGATDNAAVLMHHEVPNASPLSNDDLMQWIGFTGFADVSLDSTAPDFDGNSQKISYISPKFYGFSLGVSYIPGADVKVPFAQGNNGAEDASVLRVAPDFFNAWTATAAYDGKVGPVLLGADVGVSSYNVSGGDAATLYNGAISAEMNGFTASFGYMYADYSAELGQLEDAQAWEVGVGYKADKFATSISWFESKDGDIKGFGSDDGKVDIFKVAGDYKLAAGVDAFAQFAYVDTKSSFFVEDPSAWTIITGLGLTF